LSLQVIAYAVICVLLAYISGLLLRYVWLGIREARKTRRPDSFLDEDPGRDGDQDDDGVVEPVHSQILGGEPGNTFSSVHYDSTSELPPDIVDDGPRSEPRFSRPAEPDGAAFGFDALLEVRQARMRLDEMQQQFASLQKEVEDLREEVAELRALSQVSPVYGEAVNLARRGYDPQLIAERCGISVAEAELVQSLSGGSTEQEAGNAGS